MALVVVPAPVSPLCTLHPAHTRTLTAVAGSRARSGGWAVGLSGRGAGGGEAEAEGEQRRRSPLPLRCYADSALEVCLGANGQMHQRRGQPVQLLLPWDAMQRLRWQQFMDRSQAPCTLARLLAWSGEWDRVGQAG